MADDSRTFSDSWYRVAKQTITLRPRVDVRRQVFRGERWYVLSDPFNNQFFRVRPEAYAFIARLRPGRTVEEAWQETLDFMSGLPDTNIPSDLAVDDLCFAG